MGICADALRAATRAYHAPLASPDHDEIMTVHNVALRIARPVR